MIQARTPVSPACAASRLSRTVSIGSRPGTPWSQRGGLRIQAPSPELPPSPNCYDFLPYHRGASTFRMPALSMPYAGRTLAAGLTGVTMKNDDRPLTTAMIHTSTPTPRFAVPAGPPFSSSGPTPSRSKPSRKPYRRVVAGRQTASVPVKNLPKQTQFTLWLQHQTRKANPFQTQTNPIFNGSGPKRKRTYARGHSMLCPHNAHQCQACGTRPTAAPHAEPRSGAGIQPRVEPQGGTLGHQPNMDKP